MTSRLLTPASFPQEGRYDRLVAEALHAFSTDVGYAIQVVESARSVSAKKRSTRKRN